MTESDADRSALWWREGLPFSCTLCGKCCRARGNYAFVYVNREERRRLAEHLGIPLAEFTRLYTTRDEEGYRTLKFVEGACVFLEGSTCRVHEAKPTQCRTWPFWSELLASRATYEREVRAFCPGSREGPTVAGRDIAAQVEATESALRRR